MAERSPLRNWAEYMLLQFLRVVFLSFPINLNFRSARLLAWVWARFLPRTGYDRAIANLRSAFGGQLSEEQLHQLALRSMQNFAMTGIELLQSPRFISRSSWARYVHFHNINPVLEIAMAGKPAIMVTGHFGNFELLGQIIACFLGRFHGVVRQMDNPLVNDLLARTRSHIGLKLIFKRGAIDEAEQVLKRGEMLGFLADQDAGRKGVFVDFFGRKASTFKSVALLAIEYNVPVIVGYCRRLGDRFRHELGMERIVRPEEWQGQADPVVWITQQCASAIEAYVRRCPEQYLWTHRRWKTRPKSEQPESVEGAGSAGEKRVWANVDRLGSPD